ncbi:MAG: glycosyltransferase family 39 protein [Anaerolineales bacterium]|nr:MAG: glycosyltransferase family 39 protein [Anaerolineales bacterium]
MRRTLIQPIFWHTIPLIFIIFMVLFFPFRYRFEFNPDEGINAIKAMMNTKGYQLYSEIWSDQPPIFTMLLTLCFRIFGLNIPAGRGLELLFSAATLWLAIQYLRQFWGNIHAVFGILTIMLLPYYLVLSVSIMIGLPAIALALLSFYALSLWHKFGDVKWLIVSAIAFGLSIMTKAFTAILGPIFLSGILLSGWKEYRQHRDWLKACMPSAVWLAIFSVTVGSILIIVVRPANVFQLIQGHLLAGDSVLFRAYADNRIAIFLSRFKYSIPMLLLAFLGGIAALRSRSWTAMYLVAWVAIGSISLFINVPFWHHQQLLVTVPAAILAAIAIGDGLSKLQKILQLREGNVLGIAMGIFVWSLAVTFSLYRLPSTVQQFDYKLPNLRAQPVEYSEDEEILALMAEYAHLTNWVYTDRPMFAFRTQLSVPPHLAVLSKKRIAAGVLTEDQILEILVEYEPEQVLSGRLNLPVIQEYLATRNYDRIDSSAHHRLNVLEDFLQIPTSPAGSSTQE